MTLPLKQGSGSLKQLMLSECIRVHIYWIGGFLGHAELLVHNKWHVCAAVNVLYSEPHCSGRA